ncbi:hypothetical protein ACEPAF_8726 [Sanghuangporus sanghuang]
MAQWAHYSTPNEEFLKALAERPPFSPPVVKDPKEGDEEIMKQQKLTEERLRTVVEAAGSPEGIVVEEKLVPVTTPPGEIKVRVYTPQSEDSSEIFPVYVHIHGGGYCVGTLDLDEFVCRAASAKHRIVVVNVDYRLAPQFPFPTGIEDSYEAVKWVEANAASLRVDLKKGFIVGGKSAGGNFTCVITQRARSDPVLQGKLTGQILQIPSTVTHSGGYPEKFKDKMISYEQNKDDPILNRAYLALFIGAYKPGPQSDVRVSPLLAESFEGLPPAYVQIAGADVLRDEGLLYEQFMREAGVPTKLDVYTGVPHGFNTVYPELRISEKWDEDFHAGMEWLLRFSKQF